MSSSLLLTARPPSARLTWVVIGLFLALGACTAPSPGPAEPLAATPDAPAGPTSTLATSTPGASAEPLPRGPGALDDAPVGVRAAYFAARQAAAADDPRFALRPLGDALLATATLRGPGALFRAGEVELAPSVALRTTGYRCDTRDRPAGRTAPQADARRPNRALYAHGGSAEKAGRFDEWYVHGPEGLEQGFDIDDPACRGTLRVDVALEGLRAEPTEVPDALRLWPEGGGPALWYRDAVAHDARGRGLPVHLEGEGGRVTVVVDVGQAAWPVTIDPMLIPDTGGVPRSDEAPGDGAVGDKFGSAVALDGDTALVGAEKDGVGPNAGQGSVYVFQRTNGTWSLDTKLVAADGAVDDNFGHSVALEGDTAVIGANLDDGAVTIDQGSAYVFVRAAGVWTQQQKLTQVNGSTNDQFGGSVALSGDTALIGAALDDVGAVANQGTAYVFLRSNGVWAQQAALNASDGLANDNFAGSVSLSGNTAVIGAHLDDFGVRTDQGSAYVFNRTNAAWAQAQKLSVADGALGDNFGANVVIDADTIAVAATLDDVGVNTDEGTVYVFTRVNNVWAQQDQINALDLVNNLRFGLSLTLDGDSLAVTCSAALEYIFVRVDGVWTQEARLLAPANAVVLAGDTVLLGYSSENVVGNFTQGSVYFFTRTNGVWSFPTNITTGDGDQSDLLGTSVAVSATTAVVGVPGDHVGQATGRGSAYVFVQAAGVWSRQARLVAADGTNDDAFGQSVALEGDTVLIGAHLDDVGANVDQGSAYVFTRTNGNWAQSQKLTAAAGAASDLFGWSVALEGQTAVIGAPQDDAGAVANAGSAYVFVSAAGVWSQQAQLSAADAAANDAAGRSVALSGDTAVVGAPLDDAAAVVDAGSAYVFQRAGAAWAQQAKLTAAPVAATDQYGAAVAISGETLLVGVPQDDLGAVADQGSVAAYVRNNNAWTLQAQLLAADGTAGDQFGIAVALDGDTAVVGAHLDAANGHAGGGAAYAIVRTGTEWCVQTRFLSREAAAGERFGSAVAVAGAVAVVGAPRHAGPVPFGNPLEGAAYTYAVDRNLQPNGEACTCAGECQSGFCADGVCCNSACDGGACEACDTPATVGQCRFLVNGTVCRAATDTCDGVEACDGAQAACPADALLVAGTECRAASDVCDLAETCDGVAKACPNDAVKVASTECRASTDLCDAAEVCNGTLKNCPLDRAKAANTECRAATDLCDAPEVCNGALKTCPNDVLRAAGFSCRAAAGGCDLAETCDGNARACPPDALRAPGVECRAAAGVCDAAEACDGNAKTCPVDAVRDLGAECRAAAGPCDAVEGCDGALKTCPVNRFLVAGTECRAPADLCDAPEVCVGNVATCPVDRARAANTVCRAAGDFCDTAEVCNGVAMTCPNDAVKAVGVTCRPADDVCDRAEACDGAAKACPPDALAAPGVECRAANGDCDLAEACDGSLKACPADSVKVVGVACRAVAGPCDVAESCDGSLKTCPVDTMRAPGTSCRPATDLCDAAEVCDGFLPACPGDAVRAPGDTCRAAAGPCDAMEGCNGVAKTCPVDAVRPAATVCRVATDPCDQVEACDGSVKTCPNDGVKAAGTECRAANGGCDLAEACNGAVKTCPNDAFKGLGVECRAANGVCDTAEACTGAAPACPADAVRANGVPCRAASGECDVAEACNGVIKNCPADAAASAGTECRAAVGPCDAVEACDGTARSCPADTLLGPDAPCGAATCTEGRHTPPAFCPGDDVGCPPAVPESCGLYACGLDACLAECAESAECAAGAFCDQGLCEPLGENGDLCVFPGACASGFCVDGVCCDQACGGQCEACDTEEIPGECVPVVGPPHGERAPCASDGSDCAGECDGAVAETCLYPDEGILCRAAECTDGVATLAATCAGDGTCPAEQRQLCAPFVCGPETCLGDCQEDADCEPGLFCAGGVCGEKRRDGDPCGGGDQCLSGFCVDGVCCEAACDGQCEACDVGDQAGACVPVPLDGAPHGGRAPCAGVGLCAGACGGEDREACTYPAAETTCLPATCEGGVASPASACDGGGTCVESPGSSCGAYACRGGGCLLQCADALDCAVGFLCDAGQCVAQRAAGEACERADQCASRFCVDGVCCDRACGGQCEACDTAEAPGTCLPVAGVPHGERTPCASAGEPCGGACDGRDRAACVYAGADTTCRQPRCRDGVATAGATCDGAGSCPAEQRVVCAPFSCGPIGCLGDCGSDLDCAVGRFCAAGVCTPKLGPGEECAQNTQCAQGFCVDGLCCDARCAGQCEACDVAGHESACTVVTDERPHGGRSACAGIGLCQGLCTGQRRDACGYPGAEIVCRPGDCRGGVSTPESACDGNGACRRGASSSCGAYACGAAGCLDACADAADCAAGFPCIEGVCGVPPPPPDAGLALDAAGPGPDAAAPGQDASAADAGPPPGFDARVSAPDASPPVGDARLSTPDASPPPADAHLATPDAGPFPFPDANTVPADGGPKPLDFTLADGASPGDGRVAPGDGSVTPVDGANLGDGLVSADARATDDRGALADANGGRFDGSTNDGGEADGDGTGSEGEGPDADGAAGFAQGSGCQCRTGGRAPGALWAVLALIALRPRRRRSA